MWDGIQGGVGQSGIRQGRRVWREMGYDETRQGGKMRSGMEAEDKGVGWDERDKVG